MNAAPQNLGASTAGFSPTSVLTREELLDHVRHPRNRGALPGADMVHEEVNPLCGDVVTIYAKLGMRDEGRKMKSTNDGGRSHHSSLITHLSFTGGGCIISQAAASMLTEHVAGKTAEEVRNMERDDIEAMLGGRVSPSRVKCAMLPLVALKNGITSLHISHPPSLIAHL